MRSPSWRSWRLSTLFVRGFQEMDCRPIEAHSWICFLRCVLVQACVVTEWSHVGEFGGEPRLKFYWICAQLLLLAARLLVRQFLGYGGARSSSMFASYRRHLWWGACRSLIYCGEEDGIVISYGWRSVLVWPEFCGEEDVALIRCLSPESGCHRCSVSKGS